MSTATERKSARRKFNLIRWSVLLGVLAVSTVIGLLHQYVPSLRTVGVDALCPFGGVESLWRLMADGTFLKRVAWGSFVLLGGAVVTNIVFGRAFCGQFCPLGTLQELMGKARDALKIRRRELPQAFDVPARFLKYGIFGVFTVLTWQLGTLVIRPYDPWVAYHHLTSPELLANFGIGAAVLGVSLAGSFAYDRFFCKYLCPMGAFLGMFSKFSLFRVTRVADACTDCGLCDKACPANITVSAIERDLSGAECIACGECVAVCPKDGALALTAGSQGTRLSPAGLAGATFAVMAVLVVATSALGVMEFTKPALAVEADRAGGGGAFGSGAGEGAGQGGGEGREPLPAEPVGEFDTSLIKGYMTMAEVSAATGIAPAEFQTAFGVSAEELSAPIKDVKNSYGWDTQAVRDFVAARLGVEPSAATGCE